MARALAGGGRRIALLIAQNDQVVETLRRLLGTWPDLDVYFAPASTVWSTLPDWVRLQRFRPPRLRVIRDGAYRRTFESGPGLFVMTAAKFSFLWPSATTARVRPGGWPQPTYVDPFDVVVVDEAWMAPAGLWLNPEALARLLALIGDPGQILPFTKSDRWYPGMVDSPVEPLPELAARRLGEQMVVLDLNVSRRLASRTTALVGRLPAYAAAPTRPMFDAGSAAPGNPRNRRRRRLDNVVLQAGSGARRRVLERAAGKHVLGRDEDQEFKGWWLQIWLQQQLRLDGRLVRIG